MVASRTTDPVDRPLALTITALIALIIANTTPLMGLSAVGRSASTTIVGGAYDMWRQGQEVTAMIVGVCAVIAPAIYLVFLLTVLLAVRRPPAPPWVGELLRWAKSMQPWSMNEVMLLGILVALIKIAELATVDAGVGMYAVGALCCSFRRSWSRSIRTRSGSGSRGPTTPCPLSLGGVRCSAREPSHEHSWTQRCPGGTDGLRDLRVVVAARRHGRAGVLSALRRGPLLAPAAVYPVHVGARPRRGDLLTSRRTCSRCSARPRSGRRSPDTIMGGVVFLFTSGSWPLALIVLIASVMVPLGKLVALTYLLVTVQRGSITSNH
jgi:paraquat-inducible protein A